MLRLSLASCKLFFLMYAQTFFVTSVRGRGLLPTMDWRDSPMFIAFMKAAFGWRLVLALAGFAAFFALGFGAAFFAAFFFVATVRNLRLMNKRFQSEKIGMYQRITNN